MTRTRHPPGLSDISLLRLWRTAVRQAAGNRCRVCEALRPLPLECHHIIHRGQSKLLRYDSRNGVLVHRGDCHATANRLGMSVALPENYTPLLITARITFKQFLADEGITEREWRGRVKAALLAELGGGEA